MTTTAPAAQGATPVAAAGVGISATPAAAPRSSAVALDHLSQQQQTVLNVSREIPEAAKNLVTQADDLAARDRTEESIAAMRRAIAIALNHVNAHAEYIAIKSRCMVRYDEARAE